MLVQMCGDTCSCNLTLVEADVEAFCFGNSSQDGHRSLSQSTNLRYLLIAGLVIGVNVPIGADKKMARVVREKIEKHEAGLATKHDQGIFVAFRRCHTKWTLVLRRLLTALNVNQPMWRPKSVESVWCRSKCRGVLSAGLTHLDLSLLSNGLENRRNRIVHGNRVLLRTIAETERDSVGITVFTTGDKHEWNLVFGVIANLLRKAIV